MTKTLDISDAKGAKANIKDINIYGDGDTFALLCKASSEEEGWMKSTKICNHPKGCVMQVTTQQRNPDGSYVITENLIELSGINIDLNNHPRKLIAI